MRKTIHKNFFLLVDNPKYYSINKKNKSKKEESRKIWKPVDANDILKEVVSMGKIVDMLGRAQKEYYCNVTKMSGGKQPVFYKVEYEFGINARDFADEIFNKKDKLKIFGIYNDLVNNYNFNGSADYWGEEKTHYWANSHMYYEINRIIDNINSNKKCTSKIWIFEDENGNQLNNSDILNFTRSMVCYLGAINPIIIYNYEENAFRYGFDNALSIAQFVLISKIMNTELKSKRNGRAKVCINCGTLYVPTGHNQLYCNDCKKIGQNIRKARSRNKTVTK